MQNRQYLELCQRSAIGAEVYVIYNGAKYIPCSLSIWFNDVGEMQSTAVLQDLNGKTIVNCKVKDLMCLDKDTKM